MGRRRRTDLWFRVNSLIIRPPTVRVQPGRPERDNNTVDVLESETGRGRSSGAARGHRGRLDLTRVPHKHGDGPRWMPLSYRYGRRGGPRAGKFRMLCIRSRPSRGHVEEDGLTEQTLEARTSSGDRVQPHLQTTSLRKIPLKLSYPMRCTCSPTQRCIFPGRSIVGSERGWRHSRPAFVYIR